MLQNNENDAVVNVAGDIHVSANAGENTTVEKKQPLWIILWFILNTLLAVLMKQVFRTKFGFPVLMSTAHMIVGATISQIIQYTKVVKTEKTSDTANKRLRYFVLLFSLNIAFGNVAIRIVSLALSQMVRSTIPIFIMIIARIVQNTTNSTLTLLSVIPIIVGVFIIVYEDVQLTFESLVLLIIGNILAALKVVVTNLYLVEYQLHPMTMLSKLLPMASIVMFLMAVINGELQAFLLVYKEISITTYVWILFSAIMSFALNWTNFLANKNTSPLTMSILGNLKQVILVLFSVVLFHSTITGTSSIGIVIATVGLTFYSYLKVTKR